MVESIKNIKSINIKLNSVLKKGIILFLIPLVLIMITPVISKYDPSAVDTMNRLAKPSVSHLMGTDNLGRDVFSRTLSGMKISVYIGLWVTFISLVSGLIVGTIAAYYKVTTNVIMRIIDGIMSMPTIILAIILAGILGSGTKNIIMALSISYLPMIARVAKNSVESVKENEYIEASVALGKSDLYIIVKCIWPNIFSQIMIQTTFIFASAILNECILSFLGVGIRPPMASLGGMVSDGRNYMMVAPWISAFPGIMISWLVLSLNLLGDGLRDCLDPKHAN